jgi:AAA lid domain
MASIPPKIKEFSLTPNIEAFGFVKASAVNGYLTLLHKSGGAIRCEFDSKKLPTFKKRLENAISANENGVKFDSSFDSRKFVIRFIDLLVQDAEKEYERFESARRQVQNDKQKILDEINKDKSTLDISIEEWENTRKQKYNFLYNTVKENLPSIWLPLEFTLSIKCIINIAKITLPFAGIILGAPSTLKTASLIMLNKWPQTFYTDHFTSKSLVSHSTAITKDELVEIDMLPRWKNKLVLLPELAPIFTAKDEDLTHLLGILTRVLDGQGYQSDSGAHGHRGYDERIMFVLAGASVEIPHKVYKALGYLGPKLYFLRIPSHDKTQEERLANLSENFGDKEERIQAALFDYLKWLEIRPDMKIDNESGLPKIEWDHSKDEREALIYIIKLADLLAPLRGVSQIWETRGTQGSDYGYTIPIVEDPSRATTQLYNLARGRALSHGRNYVTKEDVPLVIKVVLSTGPVERVRILDRLIADNGDLTTGQITGALSIASQTAKRTMIELTLLGLVDIYPQLGTEEQAQHQGVEKKITLKPKFREWLGSKEFKELRRGFVPTDNSGYLKEGEKQDDRV